MTWNRERFLRSVAEAGVWSPEYAEDVLVRLAHNSSAIEGNTLTLSDTITLLIDELTPASPGKTMREVYEVANHREALTRIVEAVKTHAPLTDELIRALHGALLDHLAFDAGQYKTSDNMVLGASWAPTPPSRVPEAMRQWVDQVEWQLQNLDGGALLEAIAASHIAFERIHPFSDGNGRTGRAIIAYQTTRRFGVPAIIGVEQRPEYIAHLDAYQTPELARLLAERVADELTRFERFPAAQPTGGAIAAPTKDARL